MQKYQVTTKRDKSSTFDKNTESNDYKISETNIAKVLLLLPKSSDDLKQKINISLANSHDDESSEDSVLFLLNQCCELFFNASYEPCLLTSEVVLDLSWEKLNSFHWKDVPLRWQKIYSYACMFKACCLSIEATEVAQLREICRVCDMGLLMGFNILNGILHNIIQAFRPSTITTKLTTWSPSNSEEVSNESANVSQVTKVSSPSLVEFSERMKIGRPFVVKDCIDHWPARTLWNFDYLNDVAGHRLVPVELGSKYTDDSWGQNLMTVNDFIMNYMNTRDPKPTGYLAQHRLFEQIPQLRDDIYIPDYCSISKLPNCNAETDTEINAWFGPYGTISPCHYDIKHNLLAQVVGRKYVRLYSTSCSSELYPRGGVLHNTSSVDVESPNNDLFPLFAEMDKSNREECVLYPGQMLYIPPGYWHYIRSLDRSFSVSFWWD